jgi:hypothetical protein
MPHKYRLIILGAGFSRPAGFPLATELWKEIRETAATFPSDLRASKFNEDLDHYFEFCAEANGDALTRETVEFEEFMRFLDVEHYLGLLRGRGPSSALLLELRRRDQILSDRNEGGRLQRHNDWRGRVARPRKDRTVPATQSREQDFLHVGRLLQMTGRNALKGTLGGDGGIFRRKSAVYEMAKEPRVSRRALSEMMTASMGNFPDKAKGIVRQLTYLPSFFPDRGYVFLQLFHDNPGDYDTEYRPLRRKMLEFACGAAKLRFPHLKKVMGIAIDAPKYTRRNSEDFILLECENWSSEEQTSYEEANKELRFFQTGALKQHRMHVTEFPKAHRPKLPSKIGRNQLCPCGSGQTLSRSHGVTFACGSCP